MYVLCSHLCKQNTNQDVPSVGYMPRFILIALQISTSKQPLSPHTGD